MTLSVQVVGLGAPAWFIISIFVLVSGLIGTAHLVPAPHNCTAVVRPSA